MHIKQSMLTVEELDPCPHAGSAGHLPSCRAEPAALAGARVQRGVDVS